MQFTMPRLIILALCAGVCVALDLEDSIGDVPGEECSWRDDFFDTLLQEDEPALSLLQVGAAGIRKSADPGIHDSMTSESVKSSLIEDPVLSLRQVGAAAVRKGSYPAGKRDMMDSESEQALSMHAPGAHNHTVARERDPNQSSPITDLGKRFYVGSTTDLNATKYSAMARYWEVSSNGTVLNLTQQMKDTGSINFAARISTDIHVTTAGLEAHGSSRSRETNLITSRQRPHGDVFHDDVPSNAPELLKHVSLSSRVLKVMGPMLARMDEVRLLYLFLSLVFSVALLHLGFRKQLPQSSLKQASLSSQHFYKAAVSQEAAPTPGADAVVPGLDAIGKLVLPSRETWYLKSVDDVRQEHGTFKIFCMSDGMMLQIKISSESSHNGPRRSLEIFEGKSLLYRVCSSVRVLHESGQQDDTSTLRLSVLDAKYKHVGQLRLVTPTHFEFLHNAELLATLDTDDEGQMEMSAASGNRMARVSYGSGGCTISVNAWTDTGLTMSLVFASVILAGGADKF